MHPAYQVNESECQPYLPQTLVDVVLRVGVMRSVFAWGNSVQYKAMRQIFGESPGHDAEREKEGDCRKLKIRSIQQHDRKR